MTKHLQKFTAILIAVIMTFGVFTVVPFTASAVGNSIGTATSYTMGNTVSGSITESNNQDFYGFTLSTSGRITLNVNAFIYRTDYYIYDSSGNVVWSAEYQRWNDTSKKLTFSENIDLTSGTYYFCVSKNDGTGNYNFNITFVSANESFEETLNGTDNDISSPNSISLYETYYGQIANNDNRDFYGFTLSTSGRIALNVNAFIYRTDYYIYDSSGNVVWSAEYQRWNDTSKKLTFSENIDLTSDTYYFCVSKNDGTGNYDFNISIASNTNTPDDSLNPDSDDSFDPSPDDTDNLNPDNISTPSLGDIDGDGKISVNDVTDIQKYIVQLKPFTDEQMKFADVDKNGKIDVNDVTLLQKVIVKIAVI